MTQIQNQSNEQLATTQAINNQTAVLSGHFSAMAVIGGISLAGQWFNYEATKRVEQANKLVNSSVVEVRKSVQQVNSNITETNQILSKIGGNLVGIQRQLGSIEDAVRQVEKSVTNVEKAVLDNTRYQMERDKADRLDRERVNLIKHALFSMNESLRAVQEEKNKILMYVSLKALLEQFAEMNIRSEDIPEIQDKQYYANLERELKEVYEATKQSLPDEDNEAIKLWEDIDNTRDKLHRAAKSTDLKKIKEIQKTENLILDQQYREIEKTLVAAGISKSKIDQAKQMGHLNAWPYGLGSIALGAGLLASLTAPVIGALTFAGTVGGAAIAANKRKKNAPEAKVRLIDLFHNETKVDLEKAQKSFAKLEKLNETLKAKVLQIQQHYERNPFLKDLFKGIKV